MKVAICLFLAVIVGLSLANTKTHHRGCLYTFGKCTRECEEGTHAYAVVCALKTPEPSCEEPNPVSPFDLTASHKDGNMCDYSGCYCNPPTVRDHTSNKCVLLKDCSKKN